MTEYGWRIFDSNGNVMTDHTMLNCYYLDVFHLNHDGDFDTWKSYSKSFPNYKHCTVKVIQGTPGINMINLDVNITVSYNDNVPNVSVNERKTDDVGIGSTFYVVCTKLHKDAPIMSGYGIALLDGVGGVAIPDEAEPYAYEGKATIVGDSGEPIQGESGGRGYAYIETDDPEPPIVFCSPKGDSYFPDSTGGAWRSSKTPQYKKYRYAVCIGLYLEQFSGLSNDITTSTNVDILCFSRAKYISLENTNYGIYLNGDNGGTVIGGSPTLTVIDRTDFYSGLAGRGSGRYGFYVPRTAIAIMAPANQYKVINYPNDYNYTKWGVITNSSNKLIYFEEWKARYNSSTYETTHSRTGNYPYFAISEYRNNNQTCEVIAPNRHNYH